MTTLLDIPHVDVIYKHIFCYLTLNDLENLHDADATLQSLVALYIEKYCEIFNFNEEATLKNKFQDIMERKTNIKRLNFQGSKINDTKIKPLLINNQHLTYLNLNNCWYLTDNTLYIISQLLHLQHLDFGRNKSGFSRKLTQPESFKKIGKNLHGLVHLNVQYCDNINAQNIQIITSNNKNLNYLNLAGCRISLKGFQCLGKNLQKLKYLNLSHCGTIDENSFKVTIMNNANLEHFY